MKKHVLIILLAALVLGCSTTDDSTPFINDLNTQNVELRPILIAKNNLYGFGSEGIKQHNGVITDAGAWNLLMNQMNSINNVSDDFLETNIDFSKYLVIAVFDEIKRNGGHTIELKIEESFETIWVNVTYLAPQGYSYPMVTQPFHIVKIPVTSLPVIFN